MKITGEKCDKYSLAGFPVRYLTLFNDQKVMYFYIVRLVLVSVSSWEKNNLFHWKIQAFLR